MSDLQQLFKDSKNGVLVTLKRDGRPQLSNVFYTFDGEVIRISVTDDRVKTKNLRRDPRVSFYVTRPDFWAYAVAEGTATFSEIAADPHDAAVDELVEHYRTAVGEHQDWDEFRGTMVADRRLVVRIAVERIYGMG
jgi:PPOX class probable F420-dependent enzyme